MPWLKIKNGRTQVLFNMTNICKVQFEEDDKGKLTAEVSTPAGVECYDDLPARELRRQLEQFGAA